MSVIPLTVFVGLLLVAFFILLFLYHLRCSAQTGPDRDSLMPLNDEKVRPSAQNHPKKTGVSSKN